MNEWYELTNDLDTEVQPLDDLAAARVVKRARAALPRRRKRRWVAAALTAVLALSACGYAVATGKFSDWFWNYSENPRAPESSEDLLAGLGTVIGQSQTVDGTTITLEGALWDGNTLLLSLTVTGKDAAVEYGGTVKTQNSWLLPPRANLEKTAREQWPDMAEEELQANLDQMYETYRLFNDIGIDYFYNRRTETYQMQVGRQLTPRSSETEMEMNLHLENLELKAGKSIPGPFDFTFTVERKNMDRVYTGDVVIQAPGGYDCRITKVTVGPFRAEAEFEMLEAVPEDVYLSEELSLGLLRSADGQEVGGAGSGGSHRETGEDGLTHGSVFRGPFQRVVDPAAVEAVQIGEAWVDLDEMTLEK